MTGPVVVARNGLHAHGDTHHNHDKQHLDAVEDAEGSDGHITPVGKQPVVDEDDDAAGTYVHDERRHADGKNIPYNFLLQAKVGPVKMDVAFRAAEVIEHPNHAEEL